MNSSYDWWPDQTSNGGSKYFYIGPIVAVGVGAILVLLGQVFTTKIGFDMLEFCEALAVKEAAKSIWMNTGVTSALIITMVASMIQAGPFQTSGFDLDPAFVIDLQQTYQALLGFSFLMLLMSIVACVISLGYVEPLTDTNAMKFFITFPDALGDPITFLGAGLIMMYLAFVVWVAGNHGALIGIIYAAGVIYFVFFAILSWSLRSRFNPEDSDFAWTRETDASKWPSNIPYQYKIQRKDPRIRKLVNRLGKVLDYQEAVDKATAGKQEEVVDAAATAAAARDQDRAAGR